MNDNTNYLLFPHALLLIIGDSYYRDKDVPQSGKQWAKGVLDEMLTAAVDGGFKKRDILETLMARGETGDRIKKLSRQACTAAGVRLNQIIERINNGSKA